VPGEEADLLFAEEAIGEKSDDSLAKIVKLEDPADDIATLHQ
jgi:hypothetical protein